MRESGPGRFVWRPVRLALCASLLSLAGGEAFLRWLDVADPPAFEANPDYGYLMRPNQSVSTRGKRFHINQAGFRGDDFSFSKPYNALRLVFLGDSITYGGGQIRDPDLFVNRVASSLGRSQNRPMEAINLSAPGWGIENMAAYVAMKGLHDADVLIWVISEADFRRPKQTSLSSNGFFEEKPRSRLVYATLGILTVARLSLTRTVDPRPQTLSQNVETFHRTLEQITKSKTACTVVVVPAAYGDAQSREDLSRFRAGAEALSVPFLDMGSAFQRYRPEDIFLDGAHLNAHGHEVVADAVVALLQQSVLRREAERHDPAARDAGHSRKPRSLKATEAPHLLLTGVIPV
jgi:lysophospholipase L1-like esterase